MSCSISVPPAALLPTATTAALTWWLANPLVVHFFPDVVALRLSQLPTMSLEVQNKTLWALRGARAKARATKPRPADEGYPVSRADLEELYARIEAKAEREDMSRFGRMLHPMEYAWFAEQLRTALAAREATT